MGIEPAIVTLLESIKSDNPDLYTILSAMAKNVNKLDAQLNPPTVAQSKIISNPTVLPDKVQNFIYILTETSISLMWDGVSTGQVNYEVRRGTVWETATYITTTASLRVVLEPLLTGVYTFLVKSIDSNGNFSAEAASVVITIPQIQAPSLTGTAIINQATLSWVAPVSAFRIDHYRITRNDVFLANAHGTFFVYQELAAGTVTYGLAAVDIAGNIGIAATVALVIAAPQDFVLTSTIVSDLIADFQLSVYRDPFRILLIIPVNTAITWDSHFLGGGWASPQDQINAGYPIYGQPFFTPPSNWTKVFDFGVISNFVIVGVTYQTTIISGTVGINSTLEFSTDNINWTAPVPGPVALATTLRYVRLSLNFSTGGPANMIELSNLQVSLSIHQESDSGFADVLASDVDGTTITFNKTFRAITGISVLPVSPFSLFALLSGGDYNTATPHNFKTKIFDNAGVRISTRISWTARGVQ